MHPNANLKNDTDIIISAINKIELKKETIKLIKNLVNSQKSDEYCQKIKLRLENKDKSVIDNHKIQDDLLYKIVNTANKVVIPDRILIPFVTDIHEAYDHIGAYKTFKIINESFFAPKMLKRIKKILKPCEICQCSKHLTIRYDELVQPILVNKPNEIDFYGPPPTSVGGVPPTHEVYTHDNRCFFKVRCNL